MRHARWILSDDLRVVLDCEARRHAWSSLQSFLLHIRRCSYREDEGKQAAELADHLQGDDHVAPEEEKEVIYAEFEPNESLLFDMNKLALFIIHMFAQWLNF